MAAVAGILKEELTQETNVPFLSGILIMCWVVLLAWRAQNKYLATDSSYVKFTHIWQWIENVS